MHFGYKSILMISIILNNGITTLLSARAAADQDDQANEEFVDYNQDLEEEREDFKILPVAVDSVDNLDTEYNHRILQERSDSDFSTKNSNITSGCARGPPGRDGRDGNDGNDGMNGLNGRDGRDGNDGFQGLQGPTGPAGSVGPVGPAGSPGAQGVQGPEGPRGPAGSPGLPAPNPGSSGSLYIRWGRDDCRGTASLVYKGLAGGKWYNHDGGGSNYLCLPEVPEYDTYQSGVQTNRGFVYSAEYEIFDFPPYSSKRNHDVPCALCEVTNRGKTTMIPAKKSCPSGWTKEYNGYLMSAWFARTSPTEFVCVDRHPDVVTGSAENRDGVLFYPVEGRCDYGNLPCTPYINGAELTCVVCSK